MYKRWIERGVMQLSDGRFRQLWSCRRARTMIREIRRLGILSSEKVEVDGRQLLSVSLVDGLRLTGEYPVDRERFYFGWLAEEMGLHADYARILMDVVNRYIFWHMGAGYLEIEGPKEDRSFFHPQHSNLASEEPRFSRELRQSLASTFFPKEGWLVIDAGAYLGYGSVRMARTVGPRGKVVSVEASPQNMAVIQKTIQSNQLDNIETYHNAVWKSDNERIDFHVTSRQANAIDSEVVDGRSVTVRTISLPTLIKRLGKVPDLLSLTVNGAEVEAIEGLRDIPYEQRPKRILAPGWYTKDSLPRWRLIEPSLSELGYSVAVTNGGMCYAWKPLN